MPLGKRVGLDGILEHRKLLPVILVYIPSSIMYIAEYTA
jgi:hypothetical protein